MQSVSFLCPAKTCAGTNALEHLPFELGAMGAHKPMVIQDKASHDAGLAKLLVKAFSGSGMTLGISSPVPEGASREPDDLAVFIRSMYDRYREKGFDAIIALGGSHAAGIAKALNIAVSLGPDALKQGSVTQALSPLVFLPSGTDAAGGASAAAEFNGKSFETPFLSPDLVMIDPRLMVPDDRAALIDQALTCLALGCEVFAVSPALPARAYAATVVSLSWSALDQLLASGLKGSDNLKTAKKEGAACQKQLIQAAVMAGYLITSAQNPLFSLTLGREIAGRGNTGKGQVMIMVLPAVLESCQSRTLGQLLLHLSGAEGFCAVPVSQQAQAAVQHIRQLTHRLFSLSHGLLPRTLDEAGWSPGALEALGREIKEDNGLTDDDTAVLHQILACSWDGRPAIKGGPDVYSRLL